MAGLFEMSELEARKRALVAESEAYRQLLRMEIQNFRLLNAHGKQRLSWLRSGPLLLLAPLAGPLLRSFFRQRSAKGRQPGWLRLVLAALAGMRFYRRMAGTLGRWLPAFRTGRAAREEERERTARI